MTPEYPLLNKQLNALFSDESDPITNMSQFSALIFNELTDLNWAGFYLLSPEGHLQLGPFQGKVACTRIPVGAGVCGSAAEQKLSVLVDDVHSFSGHIACDSRSNSELVCPVIKGDTLLGVFDMDSPSFNRFTQQDRVGVEQLLQTLIKHTHWSKLPYFGHSSN